MLRVFTDRASGSLDERVELAKLFDQVRPGDTVVVWRLDRLGRSLRHLIDTVNALSERKVGFRSLTENIDTTTSGGKLVFHIFALGRVRAGADPRADQRRPGRRSGSGPPWRAPYGDAPRQGDHRRQMYESKRYTVEAIAKVLGVSRASIYRHLADVPAAAEDAVASAVPSSPRARAPRRA